MGLSYLEPVLSLRQVSSIFKGHTNTFLVANLNMLHLSHNVRIVNNHIMLELEMTLVSIEYSGSQTWACIRIAYRACEKHRCLHPTPRVSDLLDLMLASRICISFKYSGDVITIDPGSTL